MPPFCCLKSIVALIPPSFSGKIFATAAVQNRRRKLLRNLKVQKRCISFPIATSEVMVHCEPALEKETSKAKLQLI